jgi:hypothetical protein
MKKTLFVATTALVLVGAAVATTGRVFAQSPGDNQSSIVQKLVQKFGLNESEVRAVFEEEHKERETRMAARMEERLSQLVTDGKITETQKQAIIAKTAEMKTQHEAKMEKFALMSDEERKAAMEAERTSLEAWAKENGIDLKNVPFHFKFGKVGKGMGGDHMIRVQ